MLLLVILNYLNDLGWKVIRFTNSEVEKNLNKCVKAILKSQNELTNVPFQK